MESSTVNIKFSTYIFSVYILAWLIFTLKHVPALDRQKLTNQQNIKIDKLDKQEKKKQDIPAQQETHHSPYIKTGKLSAQVKTEHYADSYQKPSALDDSKSCKTSREIKL